MAAFTLTELIVTITILAILGVIGLLSFEGYQSSARDAKRVSNLSATLDGLRISYVRIGSYPTPDAPSVTVMSGSSIVGWQGYAGSSVIRLSGIHGDTTDPIDGRPFVYSVSAQWGRAQLLSYLENQQEASALSLTPSSDNRPVSQLSDNHYSPLSLFSSSVYADIPTGAYSDRYPFVKGSGMGILVSESPTEKNAPLQEISTGSVNVLTLTGFSAVVTNDILLQSGSLVTLKDLYPGNGVCGSAHQQPSASAPSQNLCLIGEALPVTQSGSIWTWTCPGMEWGTPTHCSSVESTNATCGQNAVTYATASGVWLGTSEGDFCTASNSTLSGWLTALSALNAGFPAQGASVAWICNSTTLGAVANCSASRGQNGVCWSASGTITSVAPSSNLCSSGVSAWVAANWSVWEWICNGSNEGSFVSCTAPIGVSGACTGLPSYAVYYGSVTSYSLSNALYGTNLSASYHAVPSSNTCQFRCGTNYTWNGSNACNANTQSASCGWSTPTNATATTASTYTQTWNGSTWTPTTNWGENQASCDFNCNANYTWNGSNACNANTMACTGSIPINASASTPTTYTWAGTSYGWTYGAGSCGFTCNTGYSWNGSSCVFTCGASTVTDGGYTYDTIQIGSQCWLKQNIKNGSMLASVGTTPGNNGMVEKWCYGTTTANCDNEGGIYTWSEAMQYSTTEWVQWICPSGWHIPTDAEWSTLVSSLVTGSCTPPYNTWSCSPAGTKLKVGGSSGFDAILWWQWYGSNYSNRNYQGYYWTSTLYGSTKAIKYAVTNDASVPSYVIRNNEATLTGYGYQVRCIQN